ncbi:hypothetical protein ACP70R_026940 [Stipagrostis hirtigluma subsp. patula]
MASKLGLCFLALNLLLVATTVHGCASCSDHDDPKPSNNPMPYTPIHEHCKGVLKFQLCASLLNNGKSLSECKKECCPLLPRVLDANAAACLCKTLKAKVLGIDLIVPLSLKLLINECRKTDFTCPP